MSWCVCLEFDKADITTTSSASAPTSTSLSPCIIAIFVACVVIFKLLPALEIAAIWVIETLLKCVALGNFMLSFLCADCAWGCIVVCGVVSVE